MLAQRRMLCRSFQPLNGHAMHRRRIGAQRGFSPDVFNYARRRQPRHCPGLQLPMEQRESMTILQVVPVVEKFSDPPVLQSGAPVRMLPREILRFYRNLDLVRLENRAVGPHDFSVYEMNTGSSECVAACLPEQRQVALEQLAGPSGLPFAVAEADCGPIQSTLAHRILYENSEAIVTGIERSWDIANCIILKPRQRQIHMH